MVGVTHAVAGAATGLAVISAAGSMPIDKQIACVFLATAGALAPDLDHPRSKAGQAVKPATVSVVTDGFYSVYFAPATQLTGLSSPYIPGETDMHLTAYGYDHQYIVQQEDKNDG